MDRVAAAVGRPRPSAGAPRTAQDGRQRGRHERHRVRQPGRPRRPGRHRRRDDAPSRSSCASPIARCPAASPSDAEAPDIERKLAGEQKPRGWGLFLIKNMVDSMDVTSDGIDPDGDPDDGTRGAQTMDDRRFGAEITRGPRGGPRRPQRRPQRPRRRDARGRLRAGRRARPAPRSASTSGGSATSTAPASRSSSGCWPTRDGTAGRSGRSA